MALVYQQTTFVVFQTVAAIWRAIKLVISTKPIKLGDSRLEHNHGLSPTPRNNTLHIKFSIYFHILQDNYSTSSKS